MDGRRHRIKVVWGLTLVIGWVACVELQFENRQDGYFLKPPYNKYKAYDPNLQKETFLLTNTQKSQLIKAEFGPFEVYQSVPSIYLSDTREWDNVTRVRHHALIDDQDVSVRLVRTPTGPDNPKLQVLLHASENPEAKASEVIFDYALPKDPNQQWCARIFAQHFSREISAVCVLSREKEACVSELLIPSDWWEGTAGFIDILYSLSPMDYNHRCVSTSNSILPDRMFSDFARNDKVYFTRISTQLATQIYQEKKDQFVLLYVPSKAFHPGSKFEVPVKLEAEANLRMFTIRAKARNGLKILSAEISAKSMWTISVDINSQQRSAVVKAYIKDDSQYTKTPWVQDIFRWWFEVDKTLDSPSQDGRILWNIEYETSEGVPMPVSRIVSHIAVDNEDEPLHIIPVLKVDEILNIAVLTGKHQVYPLNVYMVNHNGNVVEVTDAVACYTSDEAVVKVSQDCRNVYVDGTERSGSGNASIIVKYGRQTTAYTYLTVWVPETRLDIQLSDIKLSQVKGWRAPRQKPSRSSAHHWTGQDVGAEFESHRCSLRFQQAILEVFTRFQYSSGDKVVFYSSSKAYFRITDLVKGRIRVSDPRIAELTQEQVVSGKQPGRTEIQVLSPGGRVMAAKEIRVSKDKVVLERTLIVTMVTGISLEIKESKHIPGAFTGTAHLHHQLQGKYQEGVLDVVLKYSDGTVFPLRYVPPEQYHLDVISLNQHLIGIAPYASPYQPRVKALSQGKGNHLKVLLKMGTSCYKKRTDPLAMAFVYVDVDISVEKSYLERYQNDGGFMNRASERRKDTKANKEEQSSDYSGLPTEPQVQYSVGQYKTTTLPPVKDGSDKKHKKGSSGRESDREPEHDAQLQYTPVSKGMTPLEIGMYILLAIFCLAIIVLLVHFIIFIFRYRRKKVPQVNKDLVTNANDWVWIGRATLERTAVTTRSLQALMPDSDFNGNHQSSLSHKGSFSEPSSASNSNRNSTVSEYKGSECSIRITNNPFEEEEGGEQANLAAMSGLSQSVKSGLVNREPQWDYEAMGMTYDQLLEYFDNLKESSA